MKTPQTATPPPPRDAPSSEEIRRALEGILESEGFRRAERMSRFLRHVVEAAVRGEAGSLKEVAIGQAVFDRPADYDPKEDPVVRNEARRLRGKLEQFYESGPDRVPVRIEIPRGGYAPQFHLLARAAPEVAAPKAAAGRRWMVAAGLVGLLAAAYGLGAILNHRKEEPELRFARVKPVTGNAGCELHAAFDGSGKKLAFSGNGAGGYDIYVLEGNGPARRVTQHPAHELRPSWSPDGTQIAFARAEGLGYDVIVRTLASGEERTIAQLRNLVFGRPADDATQIFGNPGPAWSPRGDWLAVTKGNTSSLEGRAIHLIDAKSGAARQLSHPPANQDDLDAAFSADGQMVAFTRWRTNSASDIYVVPAEGGAERKVTRESLDFRGLAWMPGGESVLASSNRSGLYGLWLVALRDGSMRPFALAASHARDAAISPDGSKVVYSQYRQQSEVWEMALETQKARRVIAAGRQNHSARYAPDEKSIVFVSDRSGSWEIWRADTAGGGVRQLSRFEGPMVGSPRWSADGKEIAFDARPEGRSALFRMAAEGAWPLRPWQANGFEEKMPAWSGDGKWIYYNSTRGGLQQLWKSSVSEAGEAVMLSKEIATDSYEAWDGKRVFFAGREQGIWEVSTQGGEARLVAGLEQVNARRLWMADAKGIWWVRPEGEASEVWLRRFGATGSERVVRLPGALTMDTPSLASARSGTRLLYSVQKEAESQLMSLEGAGR